MGLIHEEVKHESGALISVIEREKHEISDPWCIARLECDSFVRMTPRELRDLGHWLVKQGKRLGREYKSNGAPRE